MLARRGMFVPSATLDSDSITIPSERTPAVADGIVTLTTSTFDEMVAASDKPIIVDFWAEWCGPCKMIAPILGEIASEQPGVTVAKLNVDENPEIAMRFNVMSIPTLLVFHGNEVRKKIVGAKGKGQLLQELNEFLPTSR
jgi:thioredoxin 1